MFPTMLKASKVSPEKMIRVLEESLLRSQPERERGAHAPVAPLQRLSKRLSYQYDK